MKEFNKCMYQKVKKGFTILIGVFLMFSMSTFGIFSNTKIAHADPLVEAKAKLSSMQAEFNEASNKVVIARNELEEAEYKANECQNNINEISAQIPSKQNIVAKNMKNAYMSGSNCFDNIVMIFCSKSLDDLITNVAHVNSISEKNLKAMNDLKNLKNELQEQKNSLDQNLNLAVLKKAEAEAATANIENLMDSVKNEIQIVEANQEQERQQALQAAAAQKEQIQAAAIQAQQQQQRSQVNQNNNNNSSNTPRVNPPSGGCGGSTTPAYTGNAVSTAYACIGRPYVWGAGGPNSFDCSGLVGFCYGKSGHPWTTYTFVGCACGFRQISASEAVPGDVVSNSGHCGIYIGGGQMIHAPEPGDVVKIGRVQSGMGYYRLG